MSVPLEKFLVPEGLWDRQQMSVRKRRAPSRGARAAMVLSGSAASLYRIDWMTRASPPCARRPGRRLTIVVIAACATRRASRLAEIVREDSDLARRSVRDHAAQHQGRVERERDASLRVD